eukprot:TRINITY_DN7863_c4_g1_i1.p1 TRINITY_DN7863_c4_g1~~TRINITY_DN7863_c4_g1_i1.p1  ORF type:complete len:371 (+),score=62.45 TRINITY_DN7863_c4_g1_i1:75-1187(+)
MGLSDDFLANPGAVSATLRCGICHEIFIDPVCGNGQSCQHVFCRDCIKPWLQRNPRSPSCPTCRQPMRVTDLRTNTVIRNLLDELMVKCQSQACGWTGRHDSLQHHRQICLGINHNAALEQIRQKNQEAEKFQAKIKSQAIQMRTQNDHLTSFRSKLANLDQERSAHLNSLRLKLSNLEKERREQDHELARLREQLRADESHAVAEAAKKFADMQAEEAQKAAERARLAQAAAHSLSLRAEAEAASVTAVDCPAANQQHRDRQQQILISTLTGKTLMLDVSAGDTVDTIKSLVTARTGLPAWQFYLTFQSKILTDGSCFGNYQIPKESTLRMHTRLASAPVDDEKKKRVSEMLANVDREHKKSRKALQGN